MDESAAASCPVFLVAEGVNSSVVYAWNYRLRALGCIPGRHSFAHQPSRQTAAKLLVQPDGSIVISTVIAISIPDLQSVLKWYAHTRILCRAVGKIAPFLPLLCSVPTPFSDCFASFLPCSSQPFLPTVPPNRGTDHRRVWGCTHFFKMFGT